MTVHLLLSIITGTALMSDSPAINRRYRVMASSPSSNASSMLMSITAAPPWTWSRATSIASSNSSFRIRRANFFRTGNVGSLADHQKVCILAHRQRLRSRESR